MDAAQAQTVKEIATFPGYTFAFGGLAFDSAGNLYGTGLVFKIARSSTGWKETVLYAFTGGQDGSDPVSGITLDSSGNLVGAANQGGVKTSQCPYGCGLTFKLTPST